MLVYLIMTHFNFISCVCFFMAKAGVTSHPLKAKSHNYCKSQVYYILAPHSRRVGLINQINVVFLHKLTFIKIKRIDIKIVLITSSFIAILHLISYYFDAERHYIF